MELKLHRAKCFKFWDIASVVCEEAKKNGEDDVAGCWVVLGQRILTVIYVDF